MIVKTVMNAELHCINKEATVQEAALKMAGLNIGAIIIGSPEKIEGIFSERDLMRRVISCKLNSETTLLKDVMTTNIFTIEENENPEEALILMEEKRIRHLPVINEKGICVGMLGSRDLMRTIVNLLASENIELIKHLGE